MAVSRSSGRRHRRRRSRERDALREITDDSGGRTEIVRTGRDLDPATASIADELSQQYYLGYPSTGKKDGRWHAIRVELKDVVSCASAPRADTSPTRLAGRCTAIIRACISSRRPLG